MELKEFLSNCTYNEFINWMQDVCIDNSFNNIKKHKSFKLVIVNPLEFKGEYMYYPLTYRDNLDDLHEMFRNYAIRYNPDKHIEFELSESTKLFAYSCSDELLNNNSEELKYLVEFLKSEETKPHQYINLN